MNPLPDNPGTYAVHLRLLNDQLLQIGRLGIFSFPAGEYVYSGSAFGPGGLRARLGRHLRGRGKPHWHIDYLRGAARVLGAWYSLSAHSLECQWSQALAELPGAFIPAPRFGASDCHSGCRAHLVAFSAGDNLPAFASGLQKWTPGGLFYLKADVFPFNYKATVPPPGEH
jgi:Uri superfamily endonuclease